MNVQNIAINNSQPAFNGYVGKSMINVINTAARNSLECAVSNANTEKRVVDRTALVQIEQTRCNVLKKLNIFMEKFHPQTSLNIDIDKDGSFLYLSNKELKQNNYLSKNYRPSFPNYPLQLSLRVKHIQNIEDITEQLSKDIEPIQADKQLFDCFAEKQLEKANDTSLLGKLKTILAVHKLNKISKKYGVDKDWKKIALYIRQKAIEIKKTKKQEEKILKQTNKENKRIAKKNKRIIKDILKDY